MGTTLVALQEYLKRFQEHLKASSPINDNSNITCHHTSKDNFSFVERDVQTLLELSKKPHL